MLNVSTTPNRQLPKWLRNATSVTAETLGERRNYMNYTVYLNERNELLCQKMLLIKQLLFLIVMFY